MDIQGGQKYLAHFLYFL